MAKGDIISIDTNKLKTGLSRFNSAKTKFNNNVYGTYKNSYFKTSGNSQVAKLRKTSDTLYKNLKEMYNNIKTYTEDYIESIQDLENDLKNGKCSTRDQVTMRAAINQLNAILDGADPDEIDINPKTGEVEFGSMGKFEEWATNGHGWKDSAFNINMDKFNAANASSVISYRDENGKLVKIEGYNSNERTMVMTAAMTNNMNYYRMVMNSNSGLKEKTANIYIAAYANSPAVMGFLEASNPLPVTLEKLIDVKYTKKQQSTVDASKEGLGYGAGYFGGMAFSFVTGGGLIGEKALGEGALKVIAKTGGKSLTNKKTVVFAVNRFSDVFSSAPLNISDSLKNSYHSSGKIDWKQFGKMMAVNTGSDIVFGGLLDGVGIGVGKLVSKSGNIKNAFAAIGDGVKNYNFHSKAGFMRIPGLNRDSFVMPKKGMHKLHVQVVKDVENMGLLDKNVGNKLYNMFKDDNYIYGIHRTPSQHFANSIMNEGLVLTGHGGNVNSKNVDLNLNISFRENKSDFDFAMFVRDIKSASSYKTIYDKGYAMVVRLPKNYDINDLVVYKDGQPVLKKDYIVGKIEVDNGNVYKSENTIFRNDIKDDNVSSNEAEGLLARYNELMKIKNSDEYKIYNENAKKGYAQELRQDFYAVDVELPRLQAKLDEYIGNNQNNGVAIHSNNVSESNVSSLKNDILGKIEDNFDDLSKARQAYLELNKRVHYDNQWIFGDEELKRSIYSKKGGFENLDGNNVICKGWSSLYQELLVDIGFDAEDIYIRGGNSLGSHKWVEVDLHNGKILIADATDSLNSSIDLANCKIGSPTVGFVIANADCSGMRLRNLMKDREATLEAHSRKLWENFDEKIGYAKNGYLSDLYKQAGNLFNDVDLYNDIVNKNGVKKSSFDQFTSFNIPDGVDGYEAFGYFHKIKKLYKDSFNSINIHIRGYNNGERIEGVAYIQSFDKSMIYSESLGKVFFNNLDEKDKFFAEHAIVSR